MSSQVIGCPDGYSVQIARQPGNMTGQGITPALVGNLEDIKSLSWGRTLSETSTATVEVSKCSDNCELLTSSTNWTGVDPWAHEMWIYRDNELAWMGPITYMRETPDSFILDAKDVTAWVDRREIKDFYNKFGSAAAIAYDLLVTFMTASDPDLMRGITFPEHSDGTVTVEYDAAQYVIGQKWSDLQTGGFTWTVISRALIMFGESALNNDYPFLLDASDILGDVEIVKDGMDYGNHVIGLGEGSTFGVGPTAADQAYYGKVTLPPISFPDARNYTDLQNLTNSYYAQKRDLSPELVVPAGSSLSPQTEIHNTSYFIGQPYMALDALLPGMRYDISVSDPFCRPALYPMRLGELQVTWDADSGENVAVSFAHLNR